MRRLFCPSQNISKEKITISDKNQFHHIKNVLHCKVGEAIAIFDEKGNNYSGVIEKFLPHSCVIARPVVSSSLRGPDTIVAGPKQSQERITLTVACAIPKKSKMEGVVDKLTQLGVERIIPMRTERVIVKLDSRKEKSRLERWNKVALNAVEQCQGCSLPLISPVKDLENVLLETKNYDLKLIPALIGKRRPLKDILSRSKAKNIMILIGPEGDFTQSEFDSAIRAGFIPVTLGGRVLRVETAAIAVTAFIRLYENY